MFSGCGHFPGPQRDATGEDGTKEPIDGHELRHWAVWASVGFGIGRAERSAPLKGLG